MNSLPLHPAIVHVPLGLALVMPLIAGACAWAIWSGRLGSQAWLAVLALQGLLFATAVVAINTGSAEEERVEQVVPEGVMHRHEAFAEQFAWAAGATCVLSALVLLGRRSSIATGLTVAAVAGSVAVAGLAVRVGHAGGQLVYTHNAGAAYMRASAEPAAASPASPERDGDDDTRSAGVGRER